MLRYHLFENFNAFSLSFTSWPYPLHKHNFYEIIFIKKGSGIHTINDVAVPYQAKDVFLIRPEDVHTFEIHQPTHFLYIKFNERFCKELRQEIKLNKQVDDFLVYVFAQRINLGESLSTHSKDNASLFILGDMLAKEYERKEPLHKEMIIHLFLSLLLLLSRSVKPVDLASLIQGSKDMDKLSRILSYIRTYAFDNDKMNIRTMAQYFLMSASYMSSYIKKHTGLCIQQHRTKIRIKAAEKLLAQQTHQVSEIAYQLGFLDASHFTKFFVKHHQITPGRFARREYSKSKPS